MKSHYNIEREVEYLRHDINDIRAAADDWNEMNEHTQEVYDLEWSHAVARWNYLAKRYHAQVLSPQAQHHHAAFLLVESELRQLIPLLEKLDLEVPLF